MLRIVHLLWHGYFAASEQFVVPLCQGAPILIPAVEMWELHGEDTALNAFEAQVIGGKVVFVLLDRAVISQHAHLYRQLGVVRGDRAAFTASAKVLAGIKAETCGIAKRTCAAPLVLCSVRLAGILNYWEIMPSGDGIDGVYVRWLAIEVDRNDRLRAGSDGHLQHCRVHGVRNGIDVNKDRTRASGIDRFGCRNKSVGNGNHFVARPNAESLQS